jgi:hypothetical protein
MHVLTLRELGDLESARRKDMKASGLSVAAIGFAILVIAIDFALIRAAFLSHGSEGWGGTSGNAPSPTHAMEWAYAVIFAVLIPIAFFCIPALLVAVIGRRLARNFWPSRTTM